MSDKPCFAIVDLETTGGSPRDERITELAIFRFDGQDVVDKMVTLVNPERKIQDFVVKLTGITDSMVARAPKFHEVAKRVVEITQDCILVAHNADFDYRVLRKEFKTLGYDFNVNSLCTVKLSKKLIPDLPSYSLGKLCKNVGIPVSNRHRAEGDAYATVQLFKMLLQKDTNREILLQTVTRYDVVLKKEKVTQIIGDLPNKVGVFYIHQKNGRVMYIGKGRNMKQKLSQFLAKKSKKSKTIISKMAHVSYEETGSFVIAQLIFNQQVGVHQPRFNSNYFKSREIEEFHHPDMILIGEARDVNERSVVMIKDNKLIGYSYVSWDFQITHPDILENTLTTVLDNKDNRYIVYNSLENNRFHKVIKF